LSDVDLGPGALARVATGPLPALTRLGDPELARSAAEARPGYELAHARAREAEAETLVRLTLAEERFGLALAFASPAAARRLAGLERQALAPRRQRRLDATLYRYLARWSSRCEPLGLWAGVARVTWGTESRVKETAWKITVTPELAPFYWLVAVLAGHPDYLGSQPFGLNPTLQRQPDGSWVFWAPTPVGAVARRMRVPDGVVEALERGPTDLPGLASRIEALGLDHAKVEAILRLCVGGGVLVGGLQPAWSFGNPWEALATIEVELRRSHRSAWAEARMRLEDLCGGLEARQASLGVAGALAAQDEAGELVAALADRLGLAHPPRPAAPLRCDQRQMLGVELDLGARARVEQTLAEYLRFQGAFGLGEALRQSVRRHFLPDGLRRLDDLPPPCRASGPVGSWEQLARDLGGDAGFLERTGRWRDLLLRDASSVEASGRGPLPGPPLGWLRVGFERWPAAGRAVVHGVFDDLWGPLARHAHPAGDPLAAWVRMAFERQAEEAGLDLLELVVPFPHRPNVLARPASGWAPLAPWDGRGSGAALAAAEVAVDGRRGPLLRLPGSTRPCVVVSTASADVQAGDPLVQLLLTTSGSATPSGALQASSLAFEHELQGERSSPQVVLAGGAVVRTGRTTLTGAGLRGLEAGSEAERFAAWARLARRHGLPERILARRGDGLNLLVQRDSPAAVAALLHGGGLSRLVLEHWPEQAWFPGGQVAELAVPFVRRSHCWNGGGE